jgi:hypothetical protein
MCDFNNLDETSKEKYHLELSKYADAFGGRGKFFTLLEGLRKSKPHALISNSSKYRFVGGIVSWNKVIFLDKVELFQETRKGESKRNNFLPDSKDKSYKKVLNLVRTLSPIEFVVTPKGEGAGEAFTLHVFDQIDETTTLINPLFDAIFFCSMDTIKKVLAYKPQGA